MEKVQYSYLKTLLFAWFSPNCYRDVARHWPGFAIGYGILLTVISWVLVIYSIIYVSLTVSSFELYQQLLQQGPSISVIDGQMKMNKASPHFIQAENGSRFVTFDTNAQPKDIYRYTSLILLTKTDLVILGGQKFFAISLKKFGDFSYTASDYEYLIRSILHWIIVTIIPLMVLLTIILKFLMAAILAGYTMLLNRFLRRGLTYSDCFRVTIVAMTPGSVLAMFGVVPVILPLTFLIGIFTTIFYSSFAIICLNKNN